MGIVKRAHKGQMTVELAVSIPVLLALALVVCNALAFMGQCAAFDYCARDAVRVYAASPAYGETKAECAAAMQEALEQRFNASNESVDVQVQGGPPPFITYTATLHVRPTLFGRAFAGDVFGVVLGTLDHRVSMTIDPYKPGALV